MEKERAKETDKERREAEKEGDREIMLEGKERQKTKRTEASCRDWKKNTMIPLYFSIPPRIYSTTTKVNRKAIVLDPPNSTRTEVTYWVA